MANQITVSDSGTVQVAIQQLGDVQVQISRTAIGGGISGYSGQSGYSGASGFSGYSGTSGYSGAQGTPGSSGVSGYSGQDGSVGASGTSGYSGQDGSAGASGISGYSGQDGSAGASGISGYSGQDGSAGASGISGYSGQDGSAGASGTSGYSGATGPQGVSGFSGVSGAAGAGGAQGHYGAFFDITDQAGSLTEQVVAIGSTSTASGINLAGTGEIVIQTPGVYQLTYSIQLVNTDNLIHYADIYLKFNGNVYPDSNTRFFIPARKNASDYGYTVATVDFIGIAANVNDYVELYWITNDPTNVSIDTIAAAGTTPRTPGVIVNVSQIMYTQSGYSGVSGQDGASGVSGFSGLDGASGVSGFSGLDGASGVSGFSGAPGPATPGGANTEVQYNDNGSLNASNTFTFNNTSNTVAITNLRVNSANITLGANAGLTSQGANAIAIGIGAATNTQGANAVAIGRNTGNNTQGENSVAVGHLAGETSQASGAVAIGPFAGRNGQLGNAVAIGRGAGNTTQGAGGVAIGWLAGFSTLGANSVAIGSDAGRFSLGANSVAIGTGAGRSGTAGNTIVINATGASLPGTTANALYVKPVRNTSTTNIVNYNTSTGEIGYDSNVVAGGYGVFASPANNTDTLKLVTNNKTNMNLIRLERYGDTANLGGVGTFNMYRTGGTQASPADVANGDVIYNLTTSVYGDSGNIFVDTGGFAITVDTNYGNGTVTSNATYAQGLGGPGTLNFNYDNINFGGISNLGPVSNVVITGGNVNDVLTTDGSGNLSWQAQSGGGGETFNVFLLAGM